MERTLIADTLTKIGAKVRICGWVNARRDHGVLVFVDIRDCSGVIQVIGDKKLAVLNSEDVVAIIGTVQKRSESSINAKIPTGTIEIKVESLTMLARADKLPFDMGRPELNLELLTLLDYRPLTLRHPKVAAIFKVQEIIIDSFRKTLKSLNFTEFQAPTIVPVATEGGAEVFPVKYYNHTAYLCQSPQLYKQMLVGVYERVFSVARAFRAEPSVTTRHLSEYVSLDAEMGFIDSYEDLMDTVEAVVRGIFKGIEDNCQRELSLFGVAVPRLAAKIPRLKMREAQAIIYQRTKRDNRKEPDLMPEDEKEICRWALAEKGSDLIFITHFPTEKRPFYTYPDPEDPEYTLSFDLLGKGLEWVTGGQRLNDYGQLVAAIEKRGSRPLDFGLYPQAFQYGMPPEGGFALGAERITMQVLGLDNIREASLFPRDMERVDVRLATIEQLDRTKQVGQKPLSDQIVDLLDAKGIKYQLFDHQPVYTSEDAAKVRGTDVKQGAKALVMMADNKPVLLVISAVNKIDTQKAKKILKVNNLRMATALEVAQITGVEVGAVPPFGGFMALETYVDKSLGKNDQIAFNIGLHTRSIKLAYLDWEKIVQPKLFDFSA